MPSDAESPRRPRPWLLIVSLMINLLVLGAVAGALLSPHHGRHGSHYGERKGPLTRFVETLSAPRSEELGKVLDPHRAALETARRDVREARRAVMEAAVRDPFDRPALDAALAGYGDASAKARDGRMRKFAETISAMTAGERKAFGDWTSRKRRARGWWRFGRDEHRGHGREKQ